MLTGESARRLATALHTPQTTEVLLDALHTTLGELGCRGGYTLVFATPYEDMAEVCVSTCPRFPTGARLTVAPDTLGQSLRQGTPAYFPTSQPVTLDTEAVPAVTILPLQADGEVYGALLLHDGVPQKAHETIAFLAEQLGLAFLHVQLGEERQRRHAHDVATLQALTETGKVLRTLDLDVVLATLMESALTTVGAEVGCIAVRPTKDAALTCHVAWGIDEPVLDTLRLTSGKTLVETVVQDNTPLILHTVRDEARFVPAPILEAIDSLAAFPLATHDRVLGCLLVLNVTAAADGALELLRTLSELASTAIENALLHQQTLEQESLREQLRIAGAMQRGLLPASSPTVPGMQLAAQNCPCDAAGGDYYDFFVLEPNRVGFVIGDATGHGIGAALLSTTMRAFLRALVGSTDDLGQLFERLNVLAMADFATDKFITLVFGIYDARHRTLTYASAGHDPPLFIYRRRQDVFESLSNTGLPLGAFPGATYTQGSAGPLEAGDLVLLLTDGVHEAPSAQGERFGKARVLEVIRAQCDAEPAELIAGLRTAVHDFCGGAPQEDDITLLCLRVCED